MFLTFGNRFILGLYSRKIDVIGGIMYRREPGTLGFFPDPLPLATHELDQTYQGREVYHGEVEGNVEEPIRLFCPPQPPPVECHEIKQGLHNKSNSIEQAVTDQKGICEKCDEKEETDAPTQELVRYELKQAKSPEAIDQHRESGDAPEDDPNLPLEFFSPEYRRALYGNGMRFIDHAVSLARDLGWKLKIVGNIGIELFEKLSPDKKWLAFSKDYNLYIKSTETDSIRKEGRETERFSPLN